jgi:hypothetical protein
MHRIATYLTRGFTHLQLDTMTPAVMGGHDALADTRRHQRRREAFHAASAKMTFFALCKLAVQARTVLAVEPKGAHGSLGTTQRGK